MLAGLVAPRLRAEESPAGTRVYGLEAFSSSLQPILERYNIPGATLAVARDGRIVFTGGFGYADREKQKRVQPDTRFRVWSMTKAVTAALVLRLVEQGRLQLTDRAFSLLDYPTPTYPGAQRDSRLNSITIHHLLQHSGGWDRSTAPNPLVGGTGLDPWMLQLEIARTMGVASPPTAETVIRYMLGQPLQFTPGATFSYSNFGYTVLGRIIEKVSGKPYAQAVKEFLAEAHITQVQPTVGRRADTLPDETFYYDTAGAPSQVSAFGDGLVSRPYALWAGTSDAASCLSMSAIEYLRFMMALEGEGEVPRLISAESARRMRTSQAPALGIYAYGWQDNLDVGNQRGSGHTGGMLGGFSVGFRHPDGRTKWVVLFNSLPSDAGSLYQAVTSALQGALERSSSVAEANFNQSTLGWDAWKKAKLDGVNAGANEDPDGDGVPNLMEYACGLDPTRAEALPPASLGQLADGTTVLSYRRLILSHLVEYCVETDEGNATWRAVAGAFRRQALNADGILTLVQELPVAASVRLRVTLCGTGESACLELPAPQRSGSRLTALSARGRAGIGEESLIAGFYINGSRPMTLLVRGVGNLLTTQGVGGALADPSVRLALLSGTELGRNDEWGVNAEAVDSAAREVKLQPLTPGSHDAALLATLREGVYTAQVTGANGGVGDGLAEVYEIEHAGSRLSGLSCRARISRGGNELILGFGVSGSSPVRVVVRARGPSLGAQGVSDRVNDPTIVLHSSGGIVMQNQGWAGGTAAQTEALREAMLKAGCYPLVDGSADSALLAELSPGSYSAVIAPAGTGSGVVLGEIYEVP